MQQDQTPEPSPCKGWSFSVHTAACSRNTCKTPFPTVSGYLGTNTKIRHCNTHHLCAENAAGQRQAKHFLLHYFVRLTAEGPNTDLVTIPSANKHKEFIQ